MKKLLALLLLTTATTVFAQTTMLNTLTDKQLIARWDKQAQDYGKEDFLLVDCASTKVPNSTNSFIFCQTVGNAGAVFFKRKAGRLKEVEYVVGGHPLRAASMFMRFVRGSGSGNMADVGGKLLEGAKSSKEACTTEPNARVCAHVSLDTWVMTAE